jgi:hypothetical protein
VRESLEERESAWVGARGKKLARKVRNYEIQYSRKRIRNYEEQ